MHDINPTHSKNDIIRSRKLVFPALFGLKEFWEQQQSSKMRNRQENENNVEPAVMKETKGYLHFLPLSA